MSGRPITEDDLHAYVDGRLDPARQADVAAYLEAHADVAGRIAGYGEQRAMLREMLRPVADEPIPPALNVRHLAERRARVAWPRWWAAAAVLLLSLGGAGGWTLRGLSGPPMQGVAMLGQEAAYNFSVYGPDHMHPVEMRAAAGTELTDWVAQRLGHSVMVPDLAGSGYRFMGGRVVATPQGPGALFMYDNDHGTRLVMLTVPMAADRTTPMMPMSHGDISGLSWATQGMGYSLVGPADMSVLHPLADEVKRQVGGPV
jgi:anti-sigma factor RsiW